MFKMRTMISCVVALVLLALNAAGDTSPINSTVSPPSASLNFGKGDRLCSSCDCQGSHVVCSELDGREVNFVDVPDSVTDLEVRGAGKVTFQSSSLRVRTSGSRVTVKNCSALLIQQEAVNFVDPSARLLLVVDNVDSATFETRSISARAGDFRLEVSSVQDLSVSGQAFEVLKKVNVRNVTSLSLKPGAFKPAVIGEMLDLEIRLSDVWNVNSLPKGVFTSSKSIVVSNSRIRGVMASAFSGIQMMSVRFVNTSIDRLHTSAFPDKTFIGSLAFENCSVTSMSERAVESGISDLAVVGTAIDSLSKEAFKCQVAKVAIRGNVFKTLKKRALVLQSWDELSIAGNRIDFMDSDSLMGISDPIEDRDASCAFTANKISYANRNALRLNLTLEEASVDLSGNVFEEECSCEAKHWLDIVTGALDDGAVDAMAVSTMMFNRSLCKIKDSARACFNGEDLTTFVDYDQRMCSESDASEDGAQRKECREITQLEVVWESVQGQIDVGTNKGILTVILLAAVFFSLIVSICTLIRWIAFTVQERVRQKCDDEWNFTKIEKREVEEEECDDNFRTPSPGETSHYESLPLTKEDETQSVQTARSDVAAATLTVGDRKVEVHTSGESEMSPPSSSSAAASPRATAAGKEEGIGEPPKMTFYDEMIDLLKEKLEDPENYATVADVSGQGKPQQQELYQDPFNVDVRGGVSKK